MLSLQPFFVKPAAFCVLLLLERPGSAWGVLLESPSRGTRCLQTVLRAGCFPCSPGAWEIPGDILLPGEHQDTDGLILIALTVAFPLRQAVGEQQSPAANLDTGSKPRCEEQSCGCQSGGLQETGGLSTWGF